jgi:hypothetical protein
VIKGLNSLGSIGGTSEADKTEILGSNDFAAAQKWLDPTLGIQAIPKAKYKNVTEYQKKRGVTDSMLNRTAEQIYEAKTGAYANSTEIQSAIASLPSKVAVSLMALRFNTVYGKYANGSLKAYIGNHLNVKEVETLNKIINKKPEL